MGVCISALRVLFFGAFTQKYKVGLKLGNGAFGDVFECTDRETKQVYAAKRIKAPSNTARRSKMVNEEIICARLRHRTTCPSIVHYYEGYTERHFRYLIFERIYGVDLFKAIGQRKEYTEKDAIKHMYQIMYAIEYCHDKNIMHRDLKSGNILVQILDNRIKIIDFGLAGMTDGDTIYFDRSCGTLVYMAPEILKGKPYGKPVDIWSCGAVFYNLLSGVHPFFAGDESLLIELITQVRFLFPRHEFSGVTQGSIALIKSMMVRSQSRRPTAYAARLELRRLHERQNVTYENRKSTIERLRMWECGIPPPTVLPYAKQEGIPIVPRSACLCSAHIFDDVPISEYPILTNSNASI